MADAFAGVKKLGITTLLVVPCQIASTRQATILVAAIIVDNSQRNS
jgi:hypothetical protein